MWRDAFAFGESDFAVGLEGHAHFGPGGWPGAAVALAAHSDLPKAAGTPDVAAHAALPATPVFFSVALPIPVAAKPGHAVALPGILTKAFGSNFGGYQDFWANYFGATDLTGMNFSYWNLRHESVAQWFNNGVDIGADAQVHSGLADLGALSLVGGNDIGPFAYLTAASAYSAGSPIEYMQYQINVVDPALIGPDAYTGAPTPADIVASAEAFDARYGDAVIANNNDCHWIAGALAAAAGATLTNSTQSLDPTQNVEGGFWRIAYRGSDPGTVTDWQTLVQPGDIVRMGWIGGGQHTTTVLAVNPDGSLKVYDNADFIGDTSFIGIHDANYDQSTIPGSITIYRLSPDDLYLIDGTGQAETIAGTLFSDQIDAGAADDVVSGYRGNDVILGRAGDDTIVGDKGNDTLTGGPGADHLAPGAGLDTLVYAAAGDSTGTKFDTVTGFDFLTVDTFDMPSAVDGIDARIVRGKLSMGHHFDAQLATAVSATALLAHHAVLFTPGSGTLAGDTFLIVDANGTAGYQAGEDMVLQLTRPCTSRHSIQATSSESSSSVCRFDRKSSGSARWRRARGFARLSLRTGRGAMSCRVSSSCLLGANPTTRRSPCLTPSAPSANKSSPVHPATTISAARRATIRST